MSTKTSLTARVVAAAAIALLTVGIAAVDMTLSGSNADYGLGRAAALTVEPASVDHTTAAVPVGASTGRELARAAQLRPGPRVLVLGAGGTVGSWALQYAARTSADIIATASKADQQWVRDHGAGEVIDHHTTVFDHVVADVDVVIDSVPGPEVALRALSNLKPGGHLLVCAAPLDPLNAAATDGRTVLRAAAPPEQGPHRHPLGGPGDRGPPFPLGDGTRTCGGARPAPRAATNCGPGMDDGPGDLAELRGILYASTDGRRDDARSTR